MPYNKRRADIFLFIKKLIDLICKNIFSNYF